MQQFIYISQIKIAEIIRRQKIVQGNWLTFSKQFFYVKPCKIKPFEYNSELSLVLLIKPCEYFVTTTLRTKTPN